MEKHPHQSILDEMGPAGPGTTHRDLSALMLRIAGTTLLTGTAALIIAGPAVMSRWSYTGLNLAAIMLGVAFALFLAKYSRATQVGLERAYSGHLEELSQRLRTMAYQDALTGLYNHRYFYEQFSHEIERSLRYGEPLTVLLMDMNNFKGINDTYGHIVGDKFLSLVGEVIARQIRSSDIGARYGGDEFVVLLPSTAVEEARLTAAKLSAAVSNAAAISPNDERIHLSITIGIATCPDDSRTPGELLQIADARMFELKPKRRGAATNEPHREVA
jgi:diguanylate cyclase (GGDEF)-like protein